MHVKVKVVSQARSESIKRISENLFEIRIKERPQNNEANRQVQRLLAKELNVSSKNVRLIRGYHASNKIFLIKEMS